MSRTEELYNQAVDEAMRQVEEMVREAFKQDSRLTDFVLAMGSATFSAKRIGIIDDNYTDKYPAIKPVFDFLDEWDDYLKLSGAGVWFKRDGSTLTDW
jgi:hypothetical protein